MATLEESIAIDISRKVKAGVPYIQIARDITAMRMIAEGLKLREQKLREPAGNGLR